MHNLDHKQISPVLVAFEQELSRFIKYIKKKSETGLKIKKNDEEPLARGYVGIITLKAPKRHNYRIQSTFEDGYIWWLVWLGKTLNTSIAKPNKPLNLHTKDFQCRSKRATTTLIS